MGTDSISTTKEANESLYQRIDVAPIVASVKPLIQKHEETLDAGEIPRDLSDALWDSGVFRAMLPRDFGGLDMHPVDWADLVYELSRIDGSVGWLAAIHSGSGDMREPAVMKELLADGQRWLPAGSISSAGKAYRVDGGYRVTGRWPFATGLPYSNYLTTVSIRVDHDGAPVANPDGEGPVLISGVFPMAEAEWGITPTLGLRGTGSGWFSLNDAFLPDRFVEYGWGMPVGYNDSPLHREFWAGMGHAAHALGLAQAAIDEFIVMGRRRIGRPGLVAPYGREDLDKFVVGQADSLVRAARALTREATSRAFDDALENFPITYEVEVRKEQSNLFGAHAARMALRLIVDHAGVDAVTAGGRLERIVRDLTTIQQHSVVAKREFVDIGDYLVTRDDEEGPRLVYASGGRVATGARIASDNSKGS
jgi:alkylation response protein AidB-like acyl-CoA dehydrogenase